MRCVNLQGTDITGNAKHAQSKNLYNFIFIYSIV